MTDYEQAFKTAQVTIKFANQEILKLEAQNADLVAALKLTQDTARMAAFAVDMRLQLNPNKAVEYFNNMFPEIAKALALVEGEKEE